ncbi:MAG: glycosyltransferase family 39 protein [Epsilonproteobacteria bacterium]|nr:glycosyltransferase family 39 protein [Campylobacterota bacterium]
MANKSEKHIRNLIFLFWSIVASRFALIIFLPLTDTTEARYANIALIMAKTKDWITPYFDYNVPYWGKPPLAFWFQALSYRIFGIHDFTPRLPSMLITLVTAWLIYKMLTITNNKTTALWAIIIYFSSLLVYALSGVVLLDTYLTCATTLSYVSFIMFIKGDKKYWNYLFFVGLGLGILVKGPLALVLVGGTIFIWVAFSFKERFAHIIKLPWIKGILLMLLISLPWYILAEIKTPGFLHYFFIGENFDRFLDSGWKGDRYGHAHFKPLGTIWLMWLYSSLPWGLAGIIIIFKKSLKKVSRQTFLKILKKDDISFYAIWMLFPMLFFTFSANITPTYVLYGFPALGILFSLYITSQYEYLSKYRKSLLAGVTLIPLIGALGVFYVVPKANTLKTEKFLINHYKKIAKDNEPIYFLNQKEFSDTYYMDKKIVAVDENKLYKLINYNKQKKYFIVMHKNSILKNKNIASKLHKIFNSERYTLYSNKI